MSLSSGVPFGDIVECDYSRYRLRLYSGPRQTRDVLSVEFADSVVIIVTIREAKCPLL